MAATFTAYNGFHFNFFGKPAGVDFFAYASTSTGYLFDRTGNGWVAQVGGPNEYLITAIVNSEQVQIVDRIPVYTIEISGLRYERVVDGAKTLIGILTTPPVVMTSSSPMPIGQGIERKVVEEGLSFTGSSATDIFDLVNPLGSFKTTTTFDMRGGDDVVVTANDGVDNVSGGAGSDRIETSGGDDVIFGNSQATNGLLLAQSGDGRDYLDGGAGNDSIYGNQNDDVIHGGSGNDTLYGGRQSDLIYGGDDDDLIYGDSSTGDEREAGKDELYGGAGDDRIIAGAGSDYLDAYDGNDTLDGGIGADFMAGGSGNDTFLVDDAADVVVDTEGDGTDTVRTSVSYALLIDQEIEVLTTTQDTGTASINLTGSDWANKLRGNNGVNVLDGGAGADVMAGLSGNDIYIVDEVGDRIVEATDGSIDTVHSSITYALGANLENLTLTGIAAIRGIGNRLANTITGNGAANVLDGGTSADILIGGLGNDTYVTYVTDDAADRVVEAGSGGIDTVVTGVSYALAAGQEIEGLQLLAATGSANLNLTGNEISQSLVGNNGANVLNGGVGRDAMTGRGGNDTYIVDNLGDQVTEAVGGGTDTVLCRASYALAASQEIESLQLLAATGSARLNLSGNAFAQSLVGNTGANVLDGKGGADVLTGRGGADTFAFATALGAGNVDRIVDFATEDTVRLAKSVFTALSGGTLASGAFKDMRVTGAVVDLDDRIVYDSRTGVLTYDADGSGEGEAITFAILDNKAALTHADILVA